MEGDFVKEVFIALNINKMEEFIIERLLCIPDDLSGSKER